MISVIIPTCDRNASLRTCLTCLQSGSRTSKECGYEVIVSDDGAVQSAEQLIHDDFPWVKWVRGPRKGPAANRNSGAHAATGEWLAFTDDDCLPDIGWIAAFQRAIVLHREFAVFEGKTVADRECTSLADVAPINESGGFLWSCNFAIERALFWRVGGFDECFPFAAMEDVALRETLKAQGVSIKFLSDARVCHPWRKSKPVTQLYYEYQRSLEIYISRFPNSRPEFRPRQVTVNALRRLVKTTLPGLFRYRGRGFIFALRSHWHLLLVSFRV